MVGGNSFGERTGFLTRNYSAIGVTAENLMDKMRSPEARGVNLDRAFGEVLDTHRFSHIWCSQKSSL